MDEPPAVVVPVGADPDLPDEDRADDDFPLPVLHLDDLPTPAGGPPWIDPALLGAADAPVDPAPDLSGTPAGARADLAALDADPDASWETLRDAEDPAVRALTRLWHLTPTDPSPPAWAQRARPHRGFGRHFLGITEKMSPKAEVVAVARTVRCGRSCRWRS